MEICIAAATNTLCFCSSYLKKPKAFTYHKKYEYTLKYVRRNDLN
jgi:hypothetical protein